jgi:hypothetical protein
MFGLRDRFNRKSSHPMAEAAAAAQLISDLPLDNPNSALAEAAAWLESIEPESFAPNHRLNLVSMIDEAVHASVEALTLAYVGARPGTPGQVADWRVLTEYLDRVAGAYCAVVDACAEGRHAELAPRLPLAILRAMRATTRSMKVSWLRYLPPDRASWESLVRCYRAACARSVAKTMASAYGLDAALSSPLQELTVGVMLAAAAPQSLTPRQVEIAYRAAFAHRSLFTVVVGRDAQRRDYLFDLDDPGTPGRARDDVPAGDGHMFFSADAVLAEIRPIVDTSAGAGVAMMPTVAYGDEFGASEKLTVLEHLLRFWDVTPPSRRDERRRINTKIHVEVGAQALRTVLDRAAAGGDSPVALELDGAPSLRVGATDQGRVAPFNNWTLTDFSGRGIGARFSRRLDRWLTIGSLVGFRLERSEKWCVAIVRRLRTDVRNQTDVGCQIVAKEASLVKLEGLASAGTLLELAGSGPKVRSSAVMLPADAQLDTRASLLFEPGTNAPGQSFVMHEGDIARRIRLGAVAENVDGWDRVEFEYLS